MRHQRRAAAARESFRVKFLAQDAAGGRRPRRWRTMRVSLLWVPPAAASNAARAKVTHKHRNLPGTFPQKLWIILCPTPGRGHPGGKPDIAHSRIKKMSSFLTMLTPPPETVLRVADLNRLARRTLEGLPMLWVAGEISNFTRAPSGHWYFSLKDDAAQVRCAMFRGRNQFVETAPTNGQQVEVRAQATLYEPRGEFQLQVELLRPAGLGVLYEAYEKLRAKLQAEGLFDAARKRPLPTHPRTVGVITSPAAAALRDVLSALKRRMPSTQVILYPAPVQGPSAAAALTAAVREAGRRGECDVLLLVRGGGSLEDLWAFNDEALVRAIAASPLPVVSGVGHETDFPLADFAADLRAPTPTAAAELASPDRAQLAHRLTLLARRLARNMSHAQALCGQRFDQLAHRLLLPSVRLRLRRQELRALARRLLRAGDAALAHEARRLAELRGRLRRRAPDAAASRQRLVLLAQLLTLAWRKQNTFQNQHLAALERSLRQLHPHQVLARGYAIVRDANGQVVRAAERLALGAEVSLTLARGQAQARITRVDSAASVQPTPHGKLDG